MSKSISKVLSLLFIWSILINFEAKADTIPTDKISIPYISARSAIAIDRKSRVILYEKNSDSVIPMASTTKIVTALVALKYGDLDSKVEISAKASSIRGSTVGYKKGEKIKLKELLYGLMLRSGNDAAIAIAEGVAGSIENFSVLMNEVSSQLGFIDSHFESPHGLDSQKHYTTAYDLALITAQAMQYELFNQIVASKDVPAEANEFTRSYHNINKILWQIPNATGVKTGFTGQAGKCLVTSIKHEGNDIIIVVLNCTERWRETKKIYDYIQKQYEYKTLACKDETIDELSLDSGKMVLKSEGNIVLPVKKTSIITKKVILPNMKLEDIKNGSKLGKLAILEDNKIIYSTELVCNNNNTSGKKRN
jgi:D-alanyl-D-alanine carboxypeptidase